jgi:wyosine [tRNA(Phe)-imidazoG37] synthetase (radical SAM superfamily)
MSSGRRLSPVDKQQIQRRAGIDEVDVTDCGRPKARMSELDHMPYSAEVHPCELTALDNGAPAPPRTRRSPSVTPFGFPRDFLGNRFVYVAISPRAGGLCVGVNMNPDRLCNFDCVYCEVDRHAPAAEQCLDVAVMAGELERTLAWVHSGKIREHHSYSTLPEELLKLRHVALSGDGEPTLCPNFAEALESVVHARARGMVPFFKIVLLTNATGLDLPAVKKSLKLFTASDEIWAKLDAGTPAFMERVNRPEVSMQKVLANIRLLGRQRPVIIQSLFPMIDGREPEADEIDQYIARLKELKAAGVLIPLVQIYSATRPMAHARCGHLPLKCLSRIAKTIRSVTGLRAEVY